MPPRLSRSEWRLAFLGFLMLAAMGGLVMRMWVLQVMRGEIYAGKIGGRSQVTVRIPSVRGEIRDRNGIPLVQNRASYNVDFYLKDMERGYRQRYGKLPTVVERRTIRGMPDDVTVADILKIIDTRVMPRLDELGLERDYNARQLKTHFNTNELVPWPYIEDADFATIARFSEHDLGLPGVEISQNPVRQYLYGAFAAHIFGYVGKPRNIEQLPDIHDFNYYQADVEGRSNIEKSMDVYLRGKPGVRIMQKDVKGRLESEVRLVPPKPGANVYLTLDARIQYIVEKALRHPSIGRAAAVVVDPNNGDILAMVSVPSFDPNMFIPSISPKDATALRDNPAKPEINNAVSGFPPGSTFKVITALAGLTKGLANRTYTCTGSVKYGNTVFRCWIAQKGGAHGPLKLADAIKVSCNCFFYQYANDAGGAALEHVGDEQGIGKHYHLGINEKAGIMPGPRWMLEQGLNERWGQGQTANTAIGQGNVLASPLQMAMAYATIANGGIAYEPRLIKQVLEADGTPALTEKGEVAMPDEPKIREDFTSEDGIPPELIGIIRKGLWEVVNASGGTGKSGRAPGTIAAGKTGTAQWPDRGKMSHIAWFCTFAPFDNPKYVVVVMILGGEGGGSVAAPVASHIMGQIIAMDEGRLTVNLQPLAPANNPRPFEVIKSLSYPGDNTANVEFDESDIGAGNNNSSAAQAQMSRDDARPDIRVEPDAEGRRSSRRSRQESTPRPNSGEERRNIFRKLFSR